MILFSGYFSGRGNGFRNWTWPDDKRGESTDTADLYSVSIWNMPPMSIPRSTPTSFTKTGLTNICRLHWSAALKNLQTDKEPFLTVKIKQSHHRIPVNDILFLERNLRETFIYTKSETYTVRDKLNILQQQLPDFFRVLPQKFPCEPSCSFQAPAYRNYFDHRSADSCQPRTLWRC